MYFIAKRLLTNTHVIISKEIQRNFARGRRVVNPGIDNRKQFVEDDIINFEDHDFDLESDFMNVGNTYDDHIKEIQHQKDKEQHLIVKQKYFKEKSPNFLSWADKEQIRYLHTSDPDEWTVQKLSEGFPALPEIIIKILKAHWTKKSDKKILSHDNSVQENWKLFKENKLKNLNPKLVDHLNKFTDRILNKSKQVAVPLPESSKKSKGSHKMRVSNEFSSIITSYERLKGKNVDYKEEKDISFNKKFFDKRKDDSDTYVIGNSVTISKHVTLNVLEDNINKKIMQGKVLSEDEVLLRHVTQEPKEASVKKPIEKITAPEMYKSSTKVVGVVKNNKDDYLFEYPQKIMIPKDKLQKGCTYKLNDCYYDDDGLFLYRVPGMYK